MDAISDGLLPSISFAQGQILASRRGWEYSRLLYGEQVLLRQHGWALSAVEGQIYDYQDMSQGGSTHPPLTSRVKLPKAQGLSS